jgi:hypothetical protein
MAEPITVQYKNWDVPTEVDAALRPEAERRGISLNSLLVEKLTQLSQAEAPRKRRSLDFLRGQWVEDAAFDEALTHQRRIDPDMWN